MPEAPITQQPTLRDWDDGLFDCTKDAKNCVLTAFFLPCMVCYEYHKHGECCATPLVTPHPVLVLMTNYRGTNRIKGSIIMDCVTSTFCMPCQLCQLHREFKAHHETQ
ncbi:hypothetical protein SprV_0301368200 [Sparganum proliferum]